MKTKLQLTQLSIQLMAHPHENNVFSVSGAIRLPPINGVDKFNYSFTVPSNGVPIESAKDVSLYVEEAFRQAREYFKELGAEFAHIHE